LLTNRNKTQIRFNEIVNSLKTMDNHFGKQKFRSGNIPFTMFGPFDQKADILFKDSTDGLRTNYEFTKVVKFDRNLEDFFNGIADTTYCSDSSRRQRNFSLLTLSAMVVILSRLR
jgi:hypothetical protein